jgi:hypothetical protein
MKVTKRVPGKSTKVRKIKIEGRPSNIFGLWGKENFFSNAPAVSTQGKGQSARLCTPLDILNTK